MRRTLALWLLLFGAYAATLGLDGRPGSDYAGDEPRYLAAVESLARDGRLDARPQGVGFPLLTWPAYAAGGSTAVELLLAALGALALALGYRLALAVVPDPWALGAAALAGLSAPLLAYGTAVYPELTAAALLAGAALLALRVAERPGWRPAFGCFALLGLLPWLGVRFAPAALVIGAFAAHALWRSGRRTLTVGAVELALFAVALCVGVNEALYDGPTPYSALPPGESATGASTFADYADRLGRLGTLLGDPGYGLLRWAPAFALAGVALFWLWRSRRDGLARAVPELEAVERAVGLCAAVLAVQLGVAVLLAPSADGDLFAGRHLVPALPLAVPLMALGLRRAPRVGLALALATLALSAWLYADVRWGDGSLTTADSHQLAMRPTNARGLSA